MSNTGDTKHRWSETDDIAALYVYRFGYRGIARSRNTLANLLGLPAGSFGMRIKNFEAIDNGGGLSNYARQSAGVYDRHKLTTEPELRAILLAAINKRRSP